MNLKMLIAALFWKRPAKNTIKIFAINDKEGRSVNIILDKTDEKAYENLDELISMLTDMRDSAKEKLNPARSV